MDFSKIAPYLQDPLVLIGFVLLLFFGLGRAILKAGIIPTLTQSAGFTILSRLLIYGFVLALAIVAVGFGLKYRELSEREQQAAVRLLQQEIAGNLAVVGELQKNMETILRNTQIVHNVLRHPGIRLLSTLLPAENTDPTIAVPASLDYARQQMRIARDLGLFEDRLETEKFRKAGLAITGTITRTIGAFESLADMDGKRYRISEESWMAHLPVLRQVHIVDVPRIQAIYQDMALLRTNYTVSVGYSVEYLKMLRAFFDESDTHYTPERLAGVLAAERIFMTTSKEYAGAVADKLVRIEATNRILTLAGQ